MIRSPACAGLLAALLLGGVPAVGHAQVFLASRAHPSFTVGPLFVRASVTPDVGPTAVDVMWSLVVPPDRSADEVVDGDLFLVWPGAVIATAEPGAPDAELARLVEQRGFTVIDEGRLALSAQSLYEVGGQRPT